MKFYCCGVAWQHEIGEALDLEGKVPLYSSIKDLKKNKPYCGIRC